MVSTIESLCFTKLSKIFSRMYSLKHFKSQLFLIILTCLIKYIYIHTYKTALLYSMLVAQVITTPTYTHAYTHTYIYGQEEFLSTNT